MEYTDGSIKFKVRRMGTVDGIKKLVPAGVVMPFAGNTAPDGFLLCNGQAVSRISYAELFTAIGTKYGAGDGSTTFNVPNLVNRFVEGGSVSGETKEAGLPNITGTVTNIAETFNSAGVADGAFSKETGHSAPCTPASTDNSNSGKLIFDASKSNSIYGKSYTVQPASIVMMYIIKI